MNAQQIELVQASFEMVRPIADQAAETFYESLFEIAPDYRSLFKNNMKKQGAMLMSTLGLAVGSLNNLEAILPAVRSAWRIWLLKNCLQHNTFKSRQSFLQRCRA